MLEFDRKRSLGFRLNIIAGTSVRFEPGEAKVVPLVKITGRRVIQGGNGLLDAEWWGTTSRCNIQTSSWDT